jgi:lysophospholipase L1-like esterase
LPFRALFLLAPLLLLATSCGQSSSPSAAPATAKPARAPQERVASPIPGAYAALGASETYGTGASPPTRGYAYLVARALHARTFHNTGIPGAPLSGAYQTELSAALAIRPSLATVFFGFNDLRTGVTLTSFLHDLRDMVKTLRLAHAQVLVIGLPDLSALPAVKAVVPNAHPIVVQWNTGMQRVARETGAHFLNLDAFTRELVTHPSYIAHDGLHPSNGGHARLSQVVTAAIRRDHLWSVR